MSASAVPSWKVTLSDIALGEDEEAAVLEVLRSRWLSVGERTSRFEEAFARHVGADHAVAVSSGTAALHLAVAATGLGPGDEALVPSLTFVATANAVRYCGAQPVFVDIVDAREPLIDPDDARAKITARTRAILPVHYAGYACDMDALLALADEHGLRVIEDGAHAPGGRAGARRIGSIGDATAFSFFSNKNMTTGEGGMVTTNDARIAEFVRTHRSHGMTRPSYDRGEGHAFAYDVRGLGWNLRPTEIASAIGLVQLGKLEAGNARRRQLTRLYRERLGGIDGVEVPLSARDESESSCHILAALLPEGTDRSSVQAALRADGIQSSMHYPPIHLFEEFRGRYPGDVPRTEAAARRLITLPLHALMSDADVTCVVDSLERALTATRAPGDRTH